MAYEGEHMFECSGSACPWAFTHVVVVSGARWNPCGHAMFNVGGTTGHYFHIAGDGYARPYHLRGADAFHRYLRENGKHELRRQSIAISKPDEAQRKLEELTSKRWLWGVLPHNCATFVEKVISAGGSSSSLYSNCPSLERF